MGDVFGMGASTLVRDCLRCSFNATNFRITRNPSAPRLATSSKDGTVRVWSTGTRKLEYALGGHTASVNVVKWGGGGLNGHGVLYTASSDRTVRVWDAREVGISFPLYVTTYTVFQGKQLHILKDHAHWVTTLALNTDFVLRTGPFDHTGKRPLSDEEGKLSALLVFFP